MDDRRRQAEAERCAHANNMNMIGAHVINLPDVINRCDPGGGRSCYHRRRAGHGVPGIGTAVGLDDRWGERVIKAVGNYGEAFKRDLGTGSALAIPRGLNELWNRGGLLYPAPIR